MEAFDRLESTNLRASQAPSPWRVVVAEYQDGGRGRLGRAWTTTPFTSLAASAVVPALTSAPGWLPLLAGLAAAEAVGQVTEAAGHPVKAALKWPNDVIVPADGDRKLAGLLCVLAPPGVVVGLGLNVDSERADLPIDTATSLRACGAPGIDREVLLTRWLTLLAGRHAQWRVDPDGVRTAYRQSCVTIGRPVEVHLPGGVLIRGAAAAVDDDGRLLVDTDDGPYAAAAGDVVHVRSQGGGHGPV